MSENGINKDLKRSWAHNQIMPNDHKVQSGADIRDLSVALEAVQAKKMELGQKLDVPLGGDYKPAHGVPVSGFDLTLLSGPDLN